MVLLEAGHVVGFGALADVAARADLPLARRDDAAGLLHCRVIDHDPARELTRLDAGGATFLVPLLTRRWVPNAGSEFPRAKSSSPANHPKAISLHNIISGTVRRIANDPTRRAAMVEIALADGALLARVTPDAVARLALSPGGPVLALIKSTSIEVLNDYRDPPTT